VLLKFSDHTTLLLKFRAVYHSLQTHARMRTFLDATLKATASLRYKRIFS